MKKLEHILSCKSFDLNFETLAFINHYFMRKDSIVREFNNGKNIMEMEEIISIMKSFDYSGINKEELVVEISKFMSSLWLHQIFFDGNTRTVVAFINYFAKVYNIPFYYDYDGGGGY